MSEYMDQETGEYVNGGIAQRAVRASNDARTHRRLIDMAAGEVQLFDAIERALNKIPEWVKAEESGQHGAKYASLKSSIQAVRPALLEHGVIMLQGMERSYSTDEGSGYKGRIFPVYTDLIHVTTGAVRRTLVEIPIGKLDAQSAGSALTYGRRYSLLAALGIASDEADDDGDRAMPPKAVTDKHEPSSDLVDLKSQIDGCKDAASVVKLGNSSSFIKQSKKLSDEERGMLRAHYSSVMAELP